jgi:hypothetical protein
MTLNIEKAREYLQNFDFKTLFIEELGWNNSKNKNAFPFNVKETQFFRKAIAELSGATIYEITTIDGNIPESKIRDAISKEIQKINFEHILIFIDKDNSQTIWRWVKKQDKKNLPREHYFSKGQTGDLFIGKLAALLVDISEIENDITITDVAKKIQSALDVEKVTKKFFKDYQDQFIGFVDFIDGIDDEADKRWYASVILNRLMFIYFLQKKMFLDGGNGNYLSDKLNYSKTALGSNKFYNTFLEKLFFEGFAKAEVQRDTVTNKLIGKIKYLNGGLFLKHKIEIKYGGKISIADVAFENLFHLFNNYSWSLDDTPGGTDNEINPDVLGYIFEKYINQKAFGAYYTRIEITEYLCEQTVYKLILNAINEPEIDDETLKKAGLDKFPKSKNFNTIPELLISLDAATCKKLIVADNAIIPNLSLLDPACGSGAFLVAAMKTLINVYAAVLGKIDFLGDSKLTEWKKEILSKHPNINYYIKKQIITNNLYGVDIMEEATEIAKLRLFLALVASANTVDQLEPLPNIDFNIMSGNSLIGLMRVDENMFNTHHQPKTPGKVAGKITQSANLFRSETVVQGSMFAENHAKSYHQLINEKEAAINAYKNAHELGITDLQKLRDSIQESEKQATKILNELLEEEFTTLGIKYEETSYDKVEKETKSIKRKIKQSDIISLEPFHWGYEFSEIFRNKNGFDAIITNPPWEVFQTNEKEFFQQYDKEIKKKKLRIEDWQKDKEQFLKDDDIREAWLNYSNQYPHQWAYFKNSAQYKNQVSVVNGKAIGNKPNLYCLFTEQCKNLLRNGGYCGIVIPSGIYTDLGTKQLREMLFDENTITALFGFENRKEIFENVHRSFKFVVLSFEKGKNTKKFPAAFMRHEVNELDNFPSYGAVNIEVELIKRLSPDSFSIIEFKNEQEVSIAKKISVFPLLYGDKVGWNLELYGEEMNMTRSSGDFLTKKTQIALYEGSMIWHYTNQFGEARYWIKEKEIREDFLSKRVKRIPDLKIKPKNLKNDYEAYRIAIRKIASNTNERTLITTVIPKYAITSNSLTVNFPFHHHPTKYNDLRITNGELLILTSILNSYVVDFILRARVTTNLNLFYLYQLPIPVLKENNNWYNIIVDKAAKLICNAEEYAELWEDVTKTKWHESQATPNEIEQYKLRAELDGIVAHIYGLNEKEFEYILSTFPIVANSQKQAALETFKALAPQFSESTKEEIQVTNIIQKGESPFVEFKSTLRVDLKTNKPEKFIEHSVIKTLAAFLNSEGGALIIGVEDNKNIMGLEVDFNSFSKPDKLDEFQKHFDNLISKTLGNRFHHYLRIEFPEIEDKTVCVITVSQKSEEPVYVVNDAGQETFYIRRTASTIDLKPSEQMKYIKEHWN